MIVPAVVLFGMSVLCPAFVEPSAQAGAANSSQVVLVAPTDGGTPRDPARIVHKGDNEFDIRASVEEGEGFLKHAISRVDLLCRNPGT